MLFLPNQPKSLCTSPMDTVGNEKDYNGPNSSHGYCISILLIWEQKFYLLDNYHHPDFQRKNVSVSQMMKTPRDMPTGPEKTSQRSLRLLWVSYGLYHYFGDFCHKICKKPSFLQPPGVGGVSAL